MVLSVRTEIGFAVLVPVSPSIFPLFELTHGNTPCHSSQALKHLQTTLFVEFFYSNYYF